MERYLLAFLEKSRSASFASNGNETFFDHIRRNQDTFGDFPNKSLNL